LAQHRFTNPPHKQRPEELFIGLMEKQLLMEPAIRWQSLVEDQLKDRCGLSGILEGGRAAAKLLKAFG
jgi:hypothetical protein